jgi:uncharacterized protein (DUF1697 family)
VTTWIALLRGINVGGRNRLAMADLRATVEAIGGSDAATVVQSGNIVFDDSDSASSGRDEAAWAEALHTAIAERHGLDVGVVVRIPGELAAALDHHPDADRIDPKFAHVAFLDREPPPDAVDAIARDAFAPDRWALVGRDLFLTYPNGSGRSRMTIDRFEQPWGVVATARNLRTVAKLVDLAGDR